MIANRFKKRNLSLNEPGKYAISPRNEERPMKPYYYDARGKISFNPIPFKLTSQTMTSSPLVYRADGTKVVKSLPPTPRRQGIRLSKRQDLVHLQENIWKREILVSLNGQPKSFRHIIHTEPLVMRKTQRKQLEEFFTVCSREFKQSIKFLYSKEGKILSSLVEIPFSDNLVIVSSSPHFNGSPILQIEEKFDRADIEHGMVSPRRKGQFNLPENIPLRQSIQTRFHLKRPEKPRNISTALPNKAKDRCEVLQDLKVRMGETLVKIDKNLPRLDKEHLRHIQNKFGLTEGEIHRSYAKFKILVLLSVAQKPSHDFQKGLLKETFIEGIRGNSKNDEQLLEKLFNTIDVDGNGYIEWEEYLQAMTVFNMGSFDQQVDMLFRMYDHQRQGKFTFDRVKQICAGKLHLQQNDEFIDNLAQSYAMLLFETTGRSTDDGIYPDDLKDLLRKKIEKPLVEMFCAFNTSN